MAYDEFLMTVSETGGYEREDAARATEAVISTLGDRLPPETAEHLADQLPDPVAELIEGAGSAPQNWGVGEFVHRVAEITGETEEQAEGHSRAVLTAVAGQVSGGELNKVISDLPSGYADLFGHPELT
ncbi:hypothetical protein GCM10023347_26860 [Streptomyces chumphonensis]|uniref:DUF2267 domain-containing protein n=1 Tax=Streptomyces chumphonensis TaxID=1214925 RepID=A0A927F003_9ACTN|nr:DUF2267 domain-containing protein [Streptomyces chumphonensis]MBD3932495.1 DUF2267 domain-containing protein [Streptomyces chumphonensis]